jgi:glycosyltransferase involved in cell wall biosynthesis
MIVAITMLKNEADIVDYTLTHLATQGIDGCYALNNLSTDNTQTILESHYPWCVTIPDPEYGYYQSRKMSDLAVKAYEAGATWILPFDADELIYHPDMSLNTFFKSLPDTIGTITIQGWDYLPRPHMSDNPNPYIRFDHRRIQPQPYPKIAFRAVPDPHIHMGNHGVDHIPGERIDGLHLRHIQYRSPTQMAAKLQNGKAVYDATDLDHGQGTHWRQGGTLTNIELDAKWSDLTTEPAIYDPLPVHFQPNVP